MLVTEAAASEVAVTAEIILDRAEAQAARTFPATFRGIVTLLRFLMQQ